MTNYHVGDSFTIPDNATGDCPSTKYREGWRGMELACVLDTGHDGHHVAVDESMTVVATWTATEERT